MITRRTYRQAQVVIILFLMAIVAIALPAQVKAADEPVPAAAHVDAGDAGAQVLAAGSPMEGHAAEADISLWWTAPFVLLLASIALMPFINKHWWEKNYPWVAIILAAIAAFYYFVLAESYWPWVHEMQEYVSFIALLASLYVVSGGIMISVRRKATPVANVVLLLIGAVIANIFGTTGAAMLLIRPYLKMNRGHIKPYHIIFFIFLVANVGGAVTPIGDPPLFLGYLYGVPFWWVLEHCYAIWAVAVVALLVLFFVMDVRDYRREQRHASEEAGPAFQMQGLSNFLFVGVILFAVFQRSLFDVIQQISQEGFGIGLAGQLLYNREVLMGLAIVGSRLFTSAKIYKLNEFSFGPIREVAILFVGIFSTMVPALQWLGVHANEMPLKTPGQFYFTSGTLSAVLDNAPTYLTFLKTKLSTIDPQMVQQAGGELRQMAQNQSLEVSDELHPDVRGALKAMVWYHPRDILTGSWTQNELQVAFLIGDVRLNLFLVAISMGAVFFGACTYIGNGPNFMVKSIAEEAGVQVPSFLAYIVKYTLPILIPIYIVIWWIFFSAWHG